MQRLNAHIAAIRHQICNRLIRFIHHQPDIGLHPRHALCHRIRLFSLIVIFMQECSNLILQPDMLCLVFCQALSKHIVMNITDHILHRGNPHFHPGITFTQQFDTISFNHGITISFPLPGNHPQTALFYR